jgi:murein DD-endopeptidase MepM/ murein hydrolase activator NlpD
MKIIFIGKNSSKPKSISLGFFILFLVILITLNFLLIGKYVSIEKYYNDTEAQYIQLGLTQKNLPDNIDLFVSQIGELNTRILQIDAQTERLQDVMKKQIIGKEKLPKLLKKKGKDSLGGPFILDNDDIQSSYKHLEKLFIEIEEREIMYNKMEAMLLRQSVLKETLPSIYPVNVPYRSSSYGWRQDPFRGVRAFHSGLDFSAAHGEPIIATAGGIVVEASHGRNYGKFITIKHGDGLETRYAHASKLFVKKGDLVNKKDIIALVGNTGRSTGPHLHYEIRLKGRPLDPTNYIRK